MKTFLVLSSCALALTSTPASDSFTSKTEAGNAYRVTLTRASSMELVDSSQSQNGEEIPAEMMGSMERSTEDELVVRFTDKVEQAADGAPTRFRRTFEEVGGEVSFQMSFEGMEEMGGPEDMDRSADLESDLVEQEVLFTNEEGAWKATPGEECELAEEDLEDLRADWSLGFFLPTEEKAEGDSWEVRAEDVEPLFILHTEVRMESGEEDMGPGAAMGRFGDREQPEIDVEGRVVVTHAGTREVEGERLVVLKLEVERETSHTVDDLMAGGDMPEDEGMPVMTPSESSMEISESMTGEGELLWNPELGRIVSLRLNLEVTRTMDSYMVIDVPQMGEFEIEGSEVEDGEVTLELRCEKLE